MGHAGTCAAGRNPRPAPAGRGGRRTVGRGQAGSGRPRPGRSAAHTSPRRLPCAEWTLKEPGTRLTQEHGARRRRRDRTVLLQVCASLPRSLTSVPPTRACCARPSAGLAVAHRVGPALIPKAVDQQAERKVPPGRLSLLFPRMCHAVQENSSVWLTRRRRRIAAPWYPGAGHTTRSGRTPCQPLTLPPADRPASPPDTVTTNVSVGQPDCGDDLHGG